MVLKALAKIYGTATGLRNRAYDSGLLPRHRAELPVISVGNITAGGNAKTPLVIFIARELAQRGWRPVVVTRGYGGTTKGPHRVMAADRPGVVGDEPCLMAHRYGLTVVVARDRFAGAQFAKAQDLGDLVILDDGFQHRRLERDVEIVSVNVGTPEARAAFEAGELLPAGRFREDRRRALGRADIVVFAERRPDPGSPLAPEVLACLPKHVSVYRSFADAVSVHALADSSAVVPPSEIVAFCGIANPENFFVTLESIGFTIKARRTFPDHYPFSPNDAAKLMQEFPGVPLVCTEKDALKCVGVPGPIYMVKIETRVYPGDAFISQIERQLREATKRIV